MKLSIIVPVYNVKKYLPSCLDSILAQTFIDWEAICIDDGSTDGSGEILDLYTKKDPRIKVIHTENGGYGRAMNLGLDKAEGDYVGIVESDDMVLSDLYETLMSAAGGGEMDVVKSECFFWWEREDYKYRFHLPHLDKYYGKELLRKQAWLRCQFLMNTWTGIYRLSFLNEYKIRHHESPGASYQDNGFWIQTMLLADKMKVIDYAGYLYRQDNESASIHDKKKVYAMSQEYDWIGENLDGRVLREEMDIVNTFRLTRGYFNLIRVADEEKREFCDRLIADYDKYGNVFYRDLIWQERFEGIKENPEGFCRELLDKKKNAEDKLSYFENIVIYGAGKRGEMLFRILCNHGYSGKIKCFAETGVPSKDHIGRIPVKQLDEADPGSRGTVVIISAAAGSKMYASMKKELQARNITDLMDSDPIIDSFYVVC